MTNDTMIGQTIGNYRVTSKLGQGGMGEVYRATDTKLGRDVAIKVLPENFAAQPERLSRFTREAKLLAGLNHPNIATLHGFEDHKGLHFLVMELVEGDTLSERIRRKPLPVKETLDIFQQIAQALEAAHDKEVVHRDLKPANVIIGTNGRVKVLDFGLAKALQPSSDSAPADAATATLTYQSTVPGRIMGTAAYMSPEQSRGQEVDKRTDVWAFGCCLYETLTGQLPFQGKTTSDLLASVLKTDPDFTLIPPETPREIVTLLRRCLEKEPHRRMRYLGDIAITIEETIHVSRTLVDTPRSPTRTRVTLPTSRAASLWWKLTALIAIATAIALAVIALPGKPAPSEIRSLAVLPFDNMTVDSELNGLDRFMQNAMLTELRKVPELETANMPAKIDALQAAGKNELEIARELSVDGVIIGNVTQQGDDISVLVSVVNGTTGREEVGETITRPFDELSSLPNDAALAIVDALKIGLQAGDRQRIATPGTQNQAAFLAYQEGLRLFDLRRLPEARGQFEHASRLDPDFASAEAYAFTATWLATLWGGTDRFPGDYFAKEADKLQRLPLDGAENAAVRLNQLWSALIYERDWKKVRDIFWNIREKDQLTGDDLYMMSVFYDTIEGRLHESLLLIEEAHALEPERLTYRVDPVWRNYSRGNYPEALRLIASFPADEIEGESFFSVLLSAGRLEEAERIAESNVGGLKDVEAQFELARIHALKGEHREARIMLSNLERLAREGIHLPYAWIARSYGYLGDMDAAFRWLQEGLDHGRGDFSMVTLRMEDLLRVFGEEPRYWKIVDGMNFPPLPIDHPYYEVEQRMRFGKGALTTSSEQSLIRTLSVLPFENLKDNDAESQWLSKALPAALKNQLKSLRQLEIKPAGFVDVDATVKGTFVINADQLQVTVSLINHKRNDTEEALGIYTKPATNIFELQDEIVIAVAEELRSDLSEEERAVIAQENNIDPDAYIAYRKGVDALDVIGFANAEEVIAHFESAIEQDPAFLAPYIQQAWALWWPTIYGTESLTSQQAFDRAYAVLAEAERVFPNEAIIPVTRDFFRMVSDFDFVTAKTRLEAALLQSPNNPDLLFMHLWYLVLIEGRYSDALRTVHRAIAEDGDRIALYDALAEVYSFMDREREALEQNSAIAAENPNDFDRLANNAFSHKHLNELSRALKNAQDALRVSNNHPAAVAVLAEIQAAMGNADESRRLLNQVEARRNAGQAIPHNWNARVEAQLGDTAAAVRSVRAAYEKREGWSFLYSMRNPHFTKLMADEPGFWQLIDEMAYPTLPINHPFYEKEQQMRFGKGSAIKSVSQAPIRTLTVLPFDNAKANDSESQWLSKTLPEALKSQLKPLKRLEIKPAGFTGVDATVQGTFVVEADHLHVTVSLLNHTRQTEEALGNFTKPAIDIFQLQNEIAIAIAEEIRSNLSDAERALIAKNSNIDPQAYIAYRRGYELYWAHATDEAIAEFTKAVTLDPDFVDPMVLLADAQWWPPMLKRTPLTPRERFDRAKERLAVAIELAPEHSGVLWQQGIIAMGGDWDWKSAQRFLRKSIVNAPDNADFHEGYSNYKISIEGNFEEALDLISDGLSLAPENASLRNLEALAFFRSGNFEKALALWGRDSHRNSEDLYNLLDTARCLIGLGQFGKAKEKTERAIVITDGHPNTYLLLAEIRARTDDAAGARSILERIEEERKTIYVSPMAISTVYGALGDWDSTFRLLEEGYVSRGGWEYTMLRTHHLLTLMGDQPRYWDLVDRMKFPALPVQHSFYEKEQEMRFGRGVSSVSTSADESKHRIRKLAVLPFTSITSEENQAWFADGITQTLTTLLGKIPTLSVIGHTSASRFKGSRDQIPEISRQLRADALIEGSVIRVGDQVQITANLVNGSSGETQWGDIFVDSVDDLLSLQGKVALEIAKSVKITMTPEDSAVLAGSDRVSRKAYEFYLQGITQKRFTEKEWRMALQFAESAIQEEPSFASAYVLKAQTLFELLYWGFERGDEVVDRIKASLEVALAIDPQLPEAQTVAGNIALYYELDFEAAERRLAQAVKDLPNVETHRRYSGVLGILERHTESIEHARLSLELDPLSISAAQSLAWALFRGGDFASALRSSEETIDIDEDSFIGHQVKAFTLIAMGRDAEAERALWRAYEESGRALQFLPRLGYGLGVLGKKVEAAKLLEQLEGLAQSDSAKVEPFYYGLLYLGLGEDDKSIEWFERAIEEHEMAVVFLGTNFYWDGHRSPLKENTTYQPLLRRIGLPE